MNCASPEFGNYLDGGLDQANFSDLVADLKSRIQNYKPTIILTFGDEGITGHKDHVVIGKAAMEAAKISDPKPKQVWRVCIPASLIPEFRNYLAGRKIHHGHYHDQELQGVSDTDLLQVDIRPFADQKKQAIHAHQSQFLPQFVREFFFDFEYFEVIDLA